MEGPSFLLFAAVTGPAPQGPIGRCTRDPADASK